MRPGLSAGSGSRALPSAVVAAESEETRVLLRGLLRMHHHRVVGEATGREEALRLVTTLHPNVLLAVHDLPAADVAALVTDARAALRDLRVVVIGGGSAALGDGLVREADAVLTRPFRVHEFARALERRAPHPPS